MQNDSNINGSESMDASPTSWEMAHQTHYDRDSDSNLTTEIIFGLAEVKGVEPTELKEPTLHDCIDVGALENTFFGPDGRRDSRETNGQVEFRYAEYQVVVQDDGWILIHEPIKG